MKPPIMTEEPMKQKTPIRRENDIFLRVLEEIAGHQMSEAFEKYILPQLKNQKVANREISEAEYQELWARIKPEIPFYVGYLLDMEARPILASGFGPTEDSTEVKGGS
jgi:hypothetical protein